LRFQAISFAIYRQYTMVTSKGALFWVSAVMVAMGIAKYVERVRALWNGDFGNIRSAVKNQPNGLRVQPPGRGEMLGNDKALLLAHELLDITKGAFTDDYLGYDAEEQLQNDSKLKEIFCQPAG
jgi:hypothetical protein